MTAAFGYLFNDLQHQDLTREEYGAEEAYKISPEVAEIGAEVSSVVASGLVGGVAALGAASLPAARGFVEYVKTNWLRVDVSAEYRDISTGAMREIGRHFHLDPLPGSNQLMRWHLPHELKQWMHHLKGKLGF